MRSRKRYHLNSNYIHFKTRLKTDVTHSTENSTASRVFHAPLFSQNRSLSPNNVNHSFSNSNLKRKFSPDINLILNNSSRKRKVKSHRNFKLPFFSKKKKRNFFYDKPKNYLILKDERKKEKKLKSARVRKIMEGVKKDFRIIQKLKNCKNCENKETSITQQEKENSSHYIARKRFKIFKSKNSKALQKIKKMERKINLSNIREKSESSRNESSSSSSISEKSPRKKKNFLEKKLSETEFELTRLQNEVYKGKKNVIQDPFYEDFKKIVNGKIGYHAHKKLTKMYEEKQREIFRSYMTLLAKNHEGGSIDIIQSLKFFGKTGYIGLRKKQELEFIKKVKKIPRNKKINFHDYVKEFQFFLENTKEKETVKVDQNMKKRAEMRNYNEFKKNFDQANENFDKIRNVQR